MLFSKAKNINKDSVKTQSVAGMLFNPNFGTSVRPLRETTTVFINLLAMIFATQGLFPRNHPSLMGVKDAPRLSLAGVLQTAWSNLTFTKEKIPQIILFFGVVAILGLSVVALFLMLFSIFVGKAHAQVWGATGGTPSYPGSVTCAGTGFFSPCDATNDIALNWINYLFQGQPMLNYLNNIGQVVPQSTIIQGAFIAALSFYSEAIMCVAAVILFYHLASMIVNTAHHGVVMGKNANQIWAPIRLVFAVGLLIPIAGGLNSGQYIVVKVAEWGSNMADQVWATFLNAVVSSTENGVSAVSPYAQKAVYDTVMSQACMAAYNAALNGWGTGGSTGGGYALNTTQPSSGVNYPAGCSYGPVNYPIANSGGVLLDAMLPESRPGTNGLPASEWYGIPQNNNLPYSPDNKSTNLQTACGHYTFPQPPPADSIDTFATTIQSALLPAGSIDCTASPGGAYGAFCNMATEAQTYVSSGTANSLPAATGAGLQPFINYCFNGTDNAPVPVNQVPISQITADYMGALDTLYAGVSSSISTAIAAAAGVSSAQGWVSAGAWFNTIARDQADLMEVADTIPATQGPAMAPIGDPTYDLDVLPRLRAFSQWIGSSYGTSVTFPSGMPSAQQQAMIAQQGMQETKKTQADEQKGNVFDEIFKYIDSTAASAGVWQGTPASGTGSFQLGVQFNGANPLAEIGALGHACIEVSIETFNSMVTLMTIGGGAQATGAAMSGDTSPITANISAAVSTLISSLGDASMAAGGLLGIVSATFFTIGFMMAFYLPLIPFFHFFFNALTWVVSLFEGIIAVPLIALAHLTPDGEGLPGGAKTAYYFIFNIFLRPVLMIFGLICGFLLFFIAVSYMNMLYVQAVAGSGAIAYGHAGLTRLIYTSIYVLMLYVSANNCFKLIGFLPENALRWMNQQGLNYGGLTGDPGQLEQGLAYATSAADTKFIGGAGQAAAGAGKFGASVPAAAGRAIGGPLGGGAGGVVGTLGMAAAVTNPKLTGQLISGVAQSSSVQKAEDMLGKLNQTGTAAMESAVKGIASSEQAHLTPPDEP